MGCSDVLLPLAEEYLLPLLPGLVFIMLEMVGTFIIRLDGSPGYASAVGIVPGTLNVLLDWLFVFPAGNVVGSSGVRGFDADDYPAALEESLCIFFVFPLNSSISRRMISVR